MLRRMIVAVILTVPLLIFLGCTPSAPNQDRLACIRSYESANVLPSPWHAYNQAGPYYGAYQYLQSTWNSHASEAGRYDLVGIPPIEPYVYAMDQDFVAGTYIENHGDTRPWGNRC